MVLITDKFHKASNGTRAEATTLTAQKALAASSITVAALNGWATDTPVDFQLYNTDTSNNIIPGSQSDWTGIVSGTTITQIQLTGGSDDIYPIGAIVVCLPTANWADSLVEGILISHDQDGTLKAGAVDNTAALADSVVTSAKIVDGTIVTADLANASITSSKLSLGALSATIATGQTTTSGTYTDLATVGPTVTATIGTNGLALLIIGATQSNNTGGGFSRTSFVASGANTIAASDTTALLNKTSAGNEDLGASRTHLLTGLTPGATTFTLKYQVSAGTGTFADRSLAVIPL